MSSRNNKLMHSIENFKDNLKINVGAGGKKYEGWISLEKKDLDITSAKEWCDLFHEYKIKNILMEHVAEHLYYEDFIKFLLIVKPYLKENAVIRVAVPDGNHPSTYVRELTGVNGTEPGGDDHKYFYKISDMYEIAKNLNYSLKSIEYFTLEGYFISNKPSFEDGYISRCSQNYLGRFTTSKEEYSKMIDSVPLNLKEQFYRLKISYTSLWVDFING